MVLILALFLTGAAFAQAIPKSVCFNTPAAGETFHLTFKNHGNTKTLVGNKKMYSVHGNVHIGALASFPVTGTAYQLNAPINTTVHLNLTGTTNYGGDMATFVYEIVWDFADTTPPVALEVRRINGDLIFPETPVLPVNLVDCITDTIPFEAENLNLLLDELKKQKQ
jgi:hypothetical protein